MKRTKRMLFIAFLVAATIALGAFSGKFTKRVAYQIQVNTIPVYSIWKHTHAVNDVGKSFDQDRFEGQRSSGDRVMTWSAISNSTEKRVITFLSRGIEVQVGVGNMITTLGEGKPRTHSPCGYNKTDPSDKFLFGFRVVHLTNHGEIADEDEWMAPDLDCQVLEYTTHFRKDNTESHPGAPDGYTISTTTKLEAVSPPEEMFMVPVGAIETSPLEYFKATHVPANPRPMYLAHLKDGDARYRAQKQAREALAASR